MSKSRFDAAGWPFFAVMTLLFVAPCIYGAWQIIDKDKNRLYPIGTGTILAILAAGVVSWAVNSVLQRREKKQRIERRKKVRKRK